ncbi:hypothetical protein, partial [Candidatus Laterigemmans baculatus]|uniref:hypothetical protein n=1 Tax=Candidatus Laterigemmans baculatus TaxID=2770505 RepID=UPI0013DB30B3
MVVAISDSGTEGSRSERSFRVTVRPVNDPPTMAPIVSSVQLDPHNPAANITIAGLTAGGNESQPLAVSVSSSNEDLLDQLTVDYDSTTQSAELRLSSHASVFGETTVLVSVTDAGFDGLFGTADDAVLTRPIQVRVVETHMDHPDEGSGHVQHLEGMPNFVEHPTHVISESGRWSQIAALENV